MFSWRHYFPPPAYNESIRFTFSWWNWLPLTAYNESMRIYVQLMELITPYSLQWVYANLRSADGTVFSLQLTNESMQIYVQLMEVITCYSLQWVNADLRSADGTDYPLQLTMSQCKFTFSWRNCFLLTAYQWVNADLCSADGSDYPLQLTMSQCGFTFSWWNWFPLKAYNESMQIYIQLTELISPYSLHWANADLRSADGVIFPLQLTMSQCEFTFSWRSWYPLTAYNESMQIYIQQTELISPYSLQWVNADLRSTGGTYFPLMYCMLSQSWNDGWIYSNAFNFDSASGELWLWFCHSLKTCWVNAEMQSVYTELRSNYNFRVD